MDPGFSFGEGVEEVMPTRTSKARSPRSLMGVVHGSQLKEKFSRRGIEGVLAPTLNHDSNWKQLSEMILCIFLLIFSKFI